jgi:hypothetical protein
MENIGNFVNFWLNRVPRKPYVPIETREYQENDLKLFRRMNKFAGGNVIFKNNR